MKVGVLRNYLNAKHQFFLSPKKFAMLSISNYKMMQNWLISIRVQQWSVTFASWEKKYKREFISFCHEFETLQSWSNSFPEKYASAHRGSVNFRHRRSFLLPLAHDLLETSQHPRSWREALLHWTLLPILQQRSFHAEAQRLYEGKRSFTTGCTIVFEV